ncbi:hypothetical protein D0859_08819 [Hortaea werneckii]|uniref:Xylanolytic transcriptional activator regulatory domain-containing protein n=1 Tax=Hortaea werneckii TaxID=91943 RepID=A0A3M7IP19_HORWE|nr:hypothetical protein D0859_08819 [Hortaea werneckii]
MELTFVHQYAGDTPKRRRLAKACESCRARKASASCVHFANGDHEGETDGSDGAAAAHNTERSSAETPNSMGGGKRFVSDLNPEAAFLNRPSSHDGETQRPPNDDIGIWVDRQEFEALLKHKNQSTGGGGGGSRQAFASSTQLERPHSAVLGPLIDIYFRRIHVFLPLLDEDEFRQQHAAGLVPEPLAHAVCLVAAKDAQAEPHLKLGNSSTALPPRDFCSRLHSSVMGALRAPCKYDKVTLIRILALVSMHNEGADVAEDASMLLSQAMHHAQTLGIHLGQQSTTPTGMDLAMKRLFWCLYALDRANSSMNGRPIIMSDVDIAIDPFHPGESGFPAFEAWLRITDLLNKIIDFYRPRVSVDLTGWEDHYPDLESIFDASQAWELSQSEQATLHLFYLCTAVLSHRSRGIKQISRGTHSAIRQRLCASEVLRLMESSYGLELNGLPFVPYSVSLALSVAYQHLRQSQFKHQQEDARAMVRQCTKILHALRRTWSSADAMATLAQKVLDELDRAPSLASFRVKRVPVSVGAAGAGGTNTGVGGRTGGGAAAGSDEPCMPALNGDRTGLKDALFQPSADPAVSGGEAAVVGNSAPSGEKTTVPNDPASSSSQAQDGGGSGSGNGCSGGVDLFNGMDDIFGTYLDPNYPNLEDFSFVDNMQPFDWSSMT